jgi:DNA-binding transcriptional LysR family regulator
MDVELRHLRALIAVVDEGTFTAAATALHTSQASVSRTIGAMERVLGARVLHRTTRELALTPVGAEVLEHARQVLDGLAALRRAAESARGDLRVGYAWAALGRHTREVQRRWSRDHPGSALRLVQRVTPTGGLLEGGVDVAVLRQAPSDPRLAFALLGQERRYAAVSADDPLARRRVLSLQDLADRTIAVDAQTGTTTDRLWPPGAAPPGQREVAGIEEWLTVIAAGEAVGLSAEGTTAQHPRAGVAYRRVRDAPLVDVHLVWWAESPPAHLADLLAVATDAYAGRPAERDNNVPPAPAPSR